MAGDYEVADNIMTTYSAEEFLNEVLSIPSVNGVNDEGEIAWFLVRYLKSCGVNAVVQEIDKSHANVIAVLEGKSNEKVIWNGHLDTVPYGKLTEWSTEPHLPVKKNGCMYGRGASDMKSGLAAMVYVLGQMNKKGIVPKRTIYFLGTSDEEKGGLGAEHILKERLMENAGFLLIGEPTDCAIGLAQKGCVWLKMKVQGATSHGAYPEMGVNAVERGICIFEQLKKKIIQYAHPLLGSATAQITMISGGIVPNMTPDEAELLLDIRTVPGLSVADILNWSKEIAENQKEKTRGKLKVSFHIENNRKALETNPEELWVKRLSKELEYEQKEVKHIGINYFTDASILTKDMDELPVVLFGPGNPELAHKPDEYVEIHKYMQYIRMLKRLF